MSKKTFIENTIAANHLNLTITGRIYFGETANAIAPIIDEAIAKGVTTATLNLTTPGGNVYEAIDIIAQLKKLPSLKIKCGSIVASAGTRIISEFEDVEANKASNFMIHKPSGPIDGNEDEAEAELKNLKNLTSDYRKAYAKKFNKTEDEIEAIWKQNYWMNSGEALKMGLVSSVVDDEIPYNASIVEEMVACGCPSVPKPPVTNINNSNTMDRNQLISALGMSADATDEQISAKIRENKTKADNASATEMQANADKKMAATNFATKAVFDKKIKPIEIPAYEALHLQNPTEAEKLVNDLPALQAGSSFVNPNSTNADSTDRTNWTLDDYLDKDPQSFEELIKTDPAKAKQLNAAYAIKK